MASTTNILVLAAVMVIVLPTIMATDFMVGDDKGWNVGVNYQEWAKGKEFVLGDRLVFKYTQGNHNVFKIANATAYQQCVKPPANDALSTGNDVITLAKPGPKWYFCGFNEHCKNGQKLAIFVRETASPAPTPTSSAHHHGVASYVFGVAVAVAAAMILL